MEDTEHMNNKRYSEQDKLQRHNVIDELEPSILAHLRAILTDCESSLITRQ